MDQRKVMVCEDREKEHPQDFDLTAAEPAHEGEAEVAFQELKTIIAVDEDDVTMPCLTGQFRHCLH